MVMPNHIYGIIEIAKTNDERENITGCDDVLKCNDVPPTTKTSERGHGYYFITLVVKNRECNLGKIVQIDDGASVILSDIKTYGFFLNIIVEIRRKTSPLR